MCVSLDHGNHGVPSLYPTRFASTNSNQKLVRSIPGEGIWYSRNLSIGCDGPRLIFTLASPSTTSAESLKCHAIKLNRTHSIN